MYVCMYVFMYVCAKIEINCTSIFCMKYYVYEYTVRAKPNLSSSSKKVLLLGLPVLPPII